MASCFIHCPPPFNSEQVRNHFFIQSSLQNESAGILSARRNTLVMLFFVEEKNETGGQHASSFVTGTKERQEKESHVMGVGVDINKSRKQFVPYGTVLVVYCMMDGSYKYSYRSNAMGVDLKALPVPQERNMVSMVLCQQKL